MLCTALLALSSGAAYALNTIKDVRTGQQNDGIRIVLDGTEDFDYDAFLLDSPNRLVIDLKNATVSGSPKVAKNRLISDFRVGNKPDIKGKRLVFDINNNVNIKKKFTIEPQAGQKNWRLVIDLSSQGLSDPSPKSNLKNAYSGAVKRKKIVVLDPGHGGKDPGAIGRSYRTYEKNITLSMGKELKKQLEAKGFKVYMTRSTDIFIPLRKRVAIARSYHADLFISIHADSAANRSARAFRSIRCPKPLPTKRRRLWRNARTKPISSTAWTSPTIRRKSTMCLFPCRKMTAATSRPNLRAMLLMKCARKLSLSAMRTNLQGLRC